jgi:S1-C subfamily serine protease
VNGRAATAFFGVMTSLLLIAGCGSNSHAANTTNNKVSPTKLSADTCAPLASPLNAVLASLVRVTTPPDASGSYAAGTGIIIDTGWVLTNEHVIDSAQGQPVTASFFGDTHRTSGRVVAADAALDLALIATDTGQLPAINWGDEGKLQQGDPLYAVGYAFGAKDPAASQPGHFVGTEVDRGSGQAYILSDVQLQHGDSGGPLLNRCGQVVGINTAREPGIDQGQYTGLSIPAFKVRDWAIKRRQALDQ